MTDNKFQDDVRFDLFSVTLDAQREDGTNNLTRPFIETEEKALQSCQPQGIAYICNRSRFSLAQDAPALFNRDMGELMSRDDQFGRIAPTDGYQKENFLTEEDVAIKPFVAVMPEHLPEPNSIYTRLTSKEHFRLLEILPGSFEASIRCRLHECSLRNSEGTYEALSYTWETGWVNPGPDKAAIECNGVGKEVQPNLYMALQRLRRRDAARIIWADAVCINQDDDEERRQQVAVMGDIFRGAHSVVVWLGVDEDADQVRESVDRKSSRAFAGVCSVISTWAEGTKDKHPAAAAISSGDGRRLQYRVHRSDDATEDLLLGNPLAGPLTADGDSSSSRTVWSDVKALFDTKWFTRLWVVQEIALARQATVIWGCCEMVWRWVGLAAAIIRTNWNRIMTDAVWGGPDWKNYNGRDDSRRLVPTGVMNAYFMYRISRCQDYFDPLQFTFCELLILTRQFACLDERDKIFGLLGLPTKDNINSSIAPSYKSTLDDVYRDVASAILQNAANPLEILPHVRDIDIYKSLYHFGSRTFGPNPSPIMFGNGGVSGTQKTLPSWVPSWHLRGPQTIAPLEGHMDFAAGLRKPTQILWKADASADPDRLVVRGIVMGEIESEGHFGSFESTWFQHTEKKDEGLNAALRGYTREGLEKLAMTLSAGKSWYGTPVEDRSTALAGFAHCLLKGRLWWALEPEAFGSLKRNATIAASQDKEGTAKVDQAGGLSTCITMDDLKGWSKGAEASLFIDAAATACVGRRLFRTTSGMSGVGPYRVKPGDQVCVIHGTPVPFIIRRDEGRKGYKLLGEAFIDDIMRGEVLEDGQHQDGWIELI